MGRRVGSVCAWVWRSCDGYDGGVMVRVLIFGPLAAELGAREIVLEIAEPATVSAVNAALAAGFPDRAAFFRSARLAVNHALAHPGHPIGPGDEVAVIELLGGG